MAEERLMMLEETMLSAAALFFGGWGQRCQSRADSAAPCRQQVRSVLVAGDWCFVRDVSLSELLLSSGHLP